MKLSLLAGLCVLASTSVYGQRKPKKQSKENKTNTQIIVRPENVRMFDNLAASYASLIPDRFVHARGTGAWGEFVCASDWSDYTQASIFQKSGQKTPVFVRFSTVVGGSASPEIVRDLRGMAVKFYTEEGNYDLLSHHLLVFLVRDPLKFNDLIHAVKASPKTGRGDATQTFRFLADAPETTHMLTRLYSHLGTPKSYRHLDACSVNAFKWRNAKGKMFYVKYTWRSKQGLESLSPEAMRETLSKNPYAHSTDLYENIENKNFPQWDLYVQILRPEQLNTLEYNPLDATKIWGETEAPSKLLGTLTLQKNPENMHLEADCAAFSPSNLITGIEPSEDRLLQARLFAYPVASRKRLGDDYMKIAVNQTKNPAQLEANYSVEILADSILTTLQTEKTADFLQPGNFFRSLSPTQQQDLIQNLSADLKAVQDETIVLKIVSHCYLADKNYGLGLAKQLQISNETLEKHLQANPSGR